MARYLGRYEHTIDEKGRLSLPSAFRSGETGEPFVLLNRRESFLTMYTESGWMDVQERLLQFRRGRRESQHDVRRIASQAADVRVDSHGRIAVPLWMKESASLEGSVLVIGNLDRIEIWSPRVYAEVVEGDWGDLEEFEHQLLG